MYAVSKGNNWLSCGQAVLGVQTANYKSFNELEQAKKCHRFWDYSVDLIDIQEDETNVMLNEIEEDTARYDLIKL